MKHFVWITFTVSILVHSTLLAQTHTSTVFSAAGGIQNSENFQQVCVFGETITGLQESANFTQQFGFVYQIGQFEPPDTVFVILEDTDTMSGNTLLLPISISNHEVPVSPEVEGYWFNLVYEHQDSLLIATGEFETEGTLSEDWFIYVNSDSTLGEVQVVGAGTTALGLDGVLIYLEFLVSENIGADSTFSVDVMEMQFNEGLPVADLVEASAIITITADSVANQETAPEFFFLHQNYPNPFNPSTTIEYGLKVPCEVEISVFNINGQLIDVIQNGFFPAGQFAVGWVPYDLPSGIYFIEMKAGSFRDVMKVSFVK